MIPEDCIFYKDYNSATGKNEESCTALNKAYCSDGTPCSFFRDRNQTVINEVKYDNYSVKEYFSTDKWKQNEKCRG